MTMYVGANAQQDLPWLPAGEPENETVKSAQLPWGATTAPLPTVIYNMGKYEVADLFPLRAHLTQGAFGCHTMHARYTHT